MQGYSKENIILIVKSTQPVTNEPIGYQLNASGYFFVSSHLRILKSAKDNTLFQQSFERIIGLFATLSFQDHNLLIFMKKLGPEKKVRIIE